MKRTFSFNTILPSQVMRYSYILYHEDYFSLVKYQTSLNLLFFSSTVLHDKVFKFKKHLFTKKMMCMHILHQFLMFWFILYKHIF